MLQLLATVTCAYSVHMTSTSERPLRYRLRPTTPLQLLPRLGDYIFVTCMHATQSFIHVCMLCILDACCKRRLVSRMVASQLSQQLSQQYHAPIYSHDRDPYQYGKVNSSAGCPSSSIHSREIRIVACASHRRQCHCGLQNFINSTAISNLMIAKKHRECPWW